MKRHNHPPSGLVPEIQALHILGWKDVMSNRIKLYRHWEGDQVKGKSKIRWYWESKLEKLKSDF
jgi:hypothetical protein